MNENDTDQTNPAGCAEKESQVEAKRKLSPAEMLMRDAVKAMRDEVKKAMGEMESESDAEAKAIATEELKNAEEFLLLSITKDGKLAMSVSAEDISVMWGAVETSKLRWLQGKGRSS